MREPVSEAEALRKRVAELEGVEAKQKQLEAELQTARAAIQHAALAKSELLVAMGSELRTPLDGILGIPSWRSRRI